MVQATLEAGWAVKDILAHISIWEGRMVRCLEEAIRGEVPQMLPPGMTWDDLDLWNEQDFPGEQREAPG
jgi:hypothetical protein